MTDEFSDIQAALDAGEEIGSFELFIDEDGFAPFAINKRGDTVDLAKYLHTPRQINKTMRVGDADSFVAYYHRFQTPETMVEVNRLKGSFHAVFDANASGIPAGERHHLIFDTYDTDEWVIWVSNNKKKMGHRTFAEFIEDNSREIESPDAATMLEIARSLTVKKDIAFTGGVRTDNGQVQMSYVENVRGSVGAKHNIGIPEILTLKMRPFEGADPVIVTARFRYRLHDGEVFMWYDLYKYQDAYRHAVDNAAAYIATGTGCGFIVNV